MADFVFNNVKGEFKTLCQLGAANDALIVVPLEAAGVEADDVLNNYDDLSALLAAANNEQTTAGRKTISASVTVTVNDTANRLDVDIPDQVWTALTGNAIGDLLICYDGDTTSGTDANIRPMTCHDWAITPDGSDVSAVIATDGFVRAA